MASIYVAGPMRGLPQFNFPAFDAAAEELRAEGWEVHNPAEHDREMYPDMESWGGWANGDASDCPGFSLSDAMVWDLDKVIHSDAIVLLPGWSSSQGATLEFEVARACGKDIYLWGEEAG
jgi:hypothetical protein